MTKAVIKPNNFTKEQSSFCPPTVAAIENKEAKTSCTFSSKPTPCQKHIRSQPWFLQCLDEFVHCECRRRRVYAPTSNTARHFYHDKSDFRVSPVSISMGLRPVLTALRAAGAPLWKNKNWIKGNNVAGLANVWQVLTRDRPSLSFSIQICLLKSILHKNVHFVLF